MSKNSVKKGKKQENERLMVTCGLFNEFLLGDIVFTLLPIGITALLKYIFGTLDSSFFLVSDWAFASIIISSLALTRTLEFKIIHQKDTSISGVALSRTCILLIIFSTIFLSLHTIKEQGIKIEDKLIVFFQLYALAIGVGFLFIAHYYREKWIFERKEFPVKISKKEFHLYSFDNLKDARNNIRSTCSAFRKEYEFTEINEDMENIREYGKKELSHIIEDIEHDLKVLKERMEAWNKPPYADPAVSEVPDDAVK